MLKRKKINIETIFCGIEKLSTQNEETEECKTTNESVFI